jgi:hypothetical protein
MSQSVRDGIGRGSCRIGHEAARALHEDTLTRYRRVLGMGRAQGPSPGYQGGGSRATASTPASRGLSAGEIGEPGAPADTQQRRSDRLTSGGAGSYGLFRR